MYGDFPTVLFLLNNYAKRFRATYLFDGGLNDGLYSGCLSSRPCKSCEVLRSDLPTRLLNSTVKLKRMQKKKKGEIAMCGQGSHFSESK